MDLAYLAVAIVITLVICAILYFIRRGMASQGWKDFLGITMAFVVLVLATAAMIFGEHALG